MAKQLTNIPRSVKPLSQVSVGDRWLTASGAPFGTVYVVHCLKVHDMEQRFGKTDRILSVRVVAHDFLSGKEKSVVDHGKLLWHSQAAKGLV